MENVFYIASALGAVGLYLMMPPRGLKLNVLGALIGIAGLGWLLLQLCNRAGQSSPSVYYYIFTAITVVSAVRVITHSRPVYSALYFVIVVLATSGLLIVLEAQFMAFAMIIIYAGAILIIYLFVIMLATLPQSSDQPDQSPIYDRTSREPLAAVVMGFALLAVLSSVLFSTSQIDQRYPIDQGEALELMEGRFESLGATTLLREAGVINIDQQIVSVDIKARTARVVTRGLPEEIDVPLPESIFEVAVTNIDRVGLNMFQSHTLGIELAGVILLLAMVGAITFARKTVVQTDQDAA